MAEDETSVGEEEVAAVLENRKKTFLGEIAIVGSHSVAAGQLHPEP